MGLGAALACLFIFCDSGVAAAHDGHLDPSFGHGGETTRWLTRGQEDIERRLRFAGGPGGGVAVAVGSTLFRFGPNGRLDRNFGEDGKSALMPSPGTQFLPEALAIDSKGRALVAGTSLYSDSEGLQGESATVYRLTTRGRLDPTFGVGGVASSTFSVPPPAPQWTPAPGVFIHHAPSVSVSGLALDAKDRPVLTGSVATGREKEAYLARLTANGSVDSTFGSGGIEIESSLEKATEPSLTDAGRLMYVGWGFEGSATLHRNRAGGAPDPSFSSLGWQAILPPREGIAGNAFGEGWRIAVDPFGRILIMAPKEIFGPVTIRRLHSNGTPDTSFGRDGTIAATIHRHDSLTTIATDSRGRILLGGTNWAWQNSRYYPDGRFELIRLRPNGKVDRNFGRNGVVLAGFGKAQATSGEEMSIDARNRVILAGPIYSSRRGVGFAMARFLTGR
jgi:uncharacterized delta-60 repeat protein